MICVCIALGDRCRDAALPDDDIESGLVSLASFRISYRLPFQQLFTLSSHSGGFTL